MDRHTANGPVAASQANSALETPTTPPAPKPSTHDATTVSSVTPERMDDVLMAIAGQATGRQVLLAIGTGAHELLAPMPPTQLKIEGVERPATPPTAKPLGHVSTSRSPVTALEGSSSDLHGVAVCECDVLKERMGEEQTRE